MKRGRKFWVFLLLFISFSLFLPGCAKKGDGINPAAAINFSVGEIDLALRYAPAASFPTGVDDDGEGKVEKGFWISETLVSYELWYELRLWAEDNGYRFGRIGNEGGRLGNFGREPSESKKQPVTRITWYDAIAWCNALSEYLGYTPLYTREGEVYRDSRNRHPEEEIITGSGEGFRLPTALEWELAARFKGSDNSHGAIENPAGSGQYWTPGNYASGATGPFTDEEATKAAAWYNRNSSIEEGGLTTHNVGLKPAEGNGLNLYDMSGNCYEFMDYPRGVYRGGCYYRGNDVLRVGFIPSGTLSMGNSYPNLSFRPILASDSADHPKTSEVYFFRNTAKAQEMGSVSTSSDNSGGENGAEEFPAGSLVEVEWQGIWYDARVLEVDGNRYYITYIGYDSSWDEWVDSKRIRPPSSKLIIISVLGAQIFFAEETPPEDRALPETAEVMLSNNSWINLEVEWEDSILEQAAPGEYELTGELVNLPEHIINPSNFAPSLRVRIREKDGPLSFLRMEAATRIDELLFYIDHDDGLKGFYFGAIPPIDLTHVLIEENKIFQSMVIYNAAMIPIQWVFPELTVQVIKPRNDPFNPAEAIHIFMLESERVEFTFDIRLNMEIGLLLDRLPHVFGQGLTEQAEVLKRVLGEMGMLGRTVSQVAASAGTPEEVAFASFLSIAGTAVRILDQLEAIGGPETASSGSFQVQPANFSGIGNIMFASDSEQIRREIAKRVFKIVEYKQGGTVIQMFSYLYRLASGHYDGLDIEGPAVSMLLCRGQSSVPNVCHEFYIPNLPGEVGRCVKLCFATLACFTDICQPMLFSVEDAKKLRQP